MEASLLSNDEISLLKAPRRPICLKNAYLADRSACDLTRSPRRIATLIGNSSASRCATLKIGLRLKMSLPTTEAH
jgi:hypothetical protein